MAETLSVLDMLPNKFEPKRQFRWVFAIEGIDSFLMKAAARPQMSIENLEIPGNFLKYWSCLGDFVEILRSSHMYTMVIYCSLTLPMTLRRFLMPQEPTGNPTCRISSPSEAPAKTV